MLFKTYGSLLCTQESIVLHREYAEKKLYFSCVHCSVLPGIICTVNIIYLTDQDCLTKS